MKRRHFLASLFGALVASKLALELTAEEPVVVGLDDDDDAIYAGFVWEADSCSQRWVFRGDRWEPIPHDPRQVMAWVRSYESTWSEWNQSA